MSPYTKKSSSLIKRLRWLLIWTPVVWGVTCGAGCDDESPSSEPAQIAGVLVADEMSAGDDLVDGMFGGDDASAGSEMISAGDVSSMMTSGDQMANGGDDVAGDQMSVAGEMSGLVEMTHTFPPTPDGYPRFSFPIHEEDRALMRASPVFGFDHDPQEGNRIRCTDYAGRGFPHCYDGHEGSDFMLEGGFEAMDAGSARVVAALSGEVVAVEDGNYDRCHADLFSADVSCDGHPMRANFVRIRHDNGWVSLYYHLKSGSVQVRRGQRVTCGEFLGLVGSSGYSSSPHLHFEVIDRRSDRWDPFAGSESQAFSLWIYQPESSSEGVDMMSSASLPSNSCSSPSK